MPEQPKPASKPSAPRAYDAALETALDNLRLTSKHQPEDGRPAPANPQQLTVQPPRPEVLSRLVNCIKKI